MSAARARRCAYCGGHAPYGPVACRAAPWRGWYLPACCGVCALAPAAPWQRAPLAGADPATRFAAAAAIGGAVRWAAGRERLLDYLARRE